MRRHYQPSFSHCLHCQRKLSSRPYLSWRKSIRLLGQNTYVTSRGRYCPKHPELTYLSSRAAHLSLPKCTYGLDVLVRIGYLHDYQRMSFPQIQHALPKHIQVSVRHLRNLYSRYLTLLACSSRLDVDELKIAAAKYGGLIVSVDGLEPEGGQPQLWVVREVLTGTLLAAGWIPQVNQLTLEAFLAPVKALDLPILATVSDKQTALINALKETWKEVPHQYCQAHYLSNAMSPIYDADQHMKTQIRKQVRAIAGKTMREVQAEAKRKITNGHSELIVTGLVVEPPAGLDEVKAIACAVQKRRKESVVQDENGPIADCCTTKDFLHVSQEDMSCLGDQVYPKMLHTTPTSSSTDIQANLTRSEISHNYVTPPAPNRIAIGSSNCSLETPIVKTISGADQVVSCAKPKMDESSLVISQKSPNNDQNAHSEVQTISQIREALLGSDVLVHQKGSGLDVRAESQISTKSVQSSREEMLDQVVEAYAGRLRRVLSRSGRKPFRMAGLRLYSDLLALLGSLETSLTYLEDEGRLTCFADAIREALLTYEGQYVSIAEAHSWVVDISEILDVRLPEAEEKVPEVALSATVGAQLESYLEKLCQRTDLDSQQLSWRKKLLGVSKRYSSGLFHCYDLPGLPRTNNDLESLFGRVRRQTLLTSGPYHAKQRLHEQGAWLLFDVVENEHEQIKRLQRVSLEEWGREQKRMLAHQATFTADRRFRNKPEKYLAELEARAAFVASLPTQS